MNYQYHTRPNTNNKPEGIIYHRLKDVNGRSADLPRNDKYELYSIPHASGTKTVFDVTAMNEYWNALASDYNAEAELCSERVQEWLDQGEIWADRVNRFVGTVRKHEAKGIVTRFRPLLSVLIEGKIHLVDGRHRYACMVITLKGKPRAGQVLCVPTYVFLEDEWKQFVVTDERVDMPLSASGS